MSKPTADKLTKLFATAGDKLTQGLQDQLGILTNSDLRRGVNIFFATSTPTTTHGVWTDESGKKPLVSLKNSWLTGHSGYATIDGLIGLVADARVTKIDIGRSSLPLVRPRTEPKLAMAV